MSTNTTPKLKLGQIETITIPDVQGLQEALGNIPSPTPPYVHPTQESIDTGNLIGAQVVSRIQVNSFGHTTNIQTRNITAANIGAQPLGNYELISNKSTNVSLGNSNTLYPTQNAVKTYVDNQVTNKVNNSIMLTAGDGLSGGGNLTVNRSFAVDNTVLRTNNTSQTKTGYFRLLRGSNSVETTIQGWDYPDNNGEDYNIRLYSRSEDNNVRFYYKQQVVLGVNDVRMNAPVLSFRNTITIIGEESYPDGELEIEDYYNLQSQPPTRHPIRLYVGGDSVFNGTIRTKNIGDSLISTNKWLLGGVTTNTDNTVDRLVRVEINGVVIDLLGRVVS